MNPKRVAAIGLVAVAVTAAGVRWLRPASPDDLLRAGRAAVARNDTAAAHKAVDALAAAGEADRAHILRADLHARAGSPAAAVAELNQVRDQAELRRQAALLSGQCQLKLGNLREAGRAFDFVLSEEPENADGHRGMAAVYYDQGALLKAEHHLKEVARLDPADGRPLRVMGLINADLDRRAEAVGCYRDALARTLPATAAAQVRDELAEQLVKLGEHAEALKALGPAGWGETPKSVAARAEAEWALGRKADAVARLDEALKAAPEAAPLLRLRGRLHAEAGEWDRAADLFARAAAADPADLTALHQLAQAYDRLGRPADAESARGRHAQVKDDLSELTALNRQADDRPWDADVRRKLAEACGRLGKEQLAAMWRRSAAACDAQRAAGSP